MFGQLGEMAGLMKKVGEMQSKMKTVKKELSELEVSGKSADGSVEIVLSADMTQVKGVRITGGSGVALEKSVAEAVAAVLTRAAEESAKRLSDVTGGIRIPGITP